MVNEPDATDGGRRQVRVVLTFYVPSFVACRCCILACMCVLRDKFDSSPAAAAAAASAAAAATAAAVASCGDRHAQETADTQ